jgi:predicted RNase H-like HicB family nuclease
MRKGCTLMFSYWFGKLSTVLVTVRRDNARTAIVDLERLRISPTSLGGYRAQVVAEADGWSVFIPGLPVAADGATFDEAIAEMVEALRKYAEDWHERLRDAPNHRNNWGLVQLISLSDDDQLRDWLHRYWTEDP